MMRTRSVSEKQRPADAGHRLVDRGTAMALGVPVVTQDGHYVEVDGLEVINV